MEDKKLTEQESLAIITEMIEASKTNFRNDSFLFLFWGWLVFIASLANYILMKMGIGQAASVWLLMLLGAIVTIIFIFRREKKSRVKTFVDEAMRFLWLPVIMCFIGLPFIISKANFAYTYPIFMMLYGIGTCASGGILKFTPFKIGGFLSIGMAFAAYFVQPEYILPLLSLSLLVSYIIPGHMLKARNQ